MQNYEKTMTYKYNSYLYFSIKVEKRLRNVVYILVGGPQAPNPLKNDLREARKVYKTKKHSEEMNLQSAL